MLPAAWLWKIYAQLCRGSSFSWCVRCSLTLAWQILCPAHMQLLPSLPRLKCVSGDKLLLDNVPHSRGLMTWQNEKQLARFSTVFIHNWVLYIVMRDRIKLTLYSSVLNAFFLSSAEFAGSIFSLIKNSPPRSSQQFSCGCRKSSWDVWEFGMNR